MDGISIIWWLSVLVTSGLLGLWFMLAKGPVVRRLSLTALVLSIAFHLLVAHNKLWVGAQSLKASVQQVGNKYTMEFADVAKRVVAINDPDRADDDQAAESLRQDVYRRLTWVRDNGQPRTQLASPDAISIGRTSLTVDFGGEKVDQAAVKRWLTGRSYKLANPERSLFHISVGIDLRGGVEFTCRLYKNGVKVSADDEVVDILRSRLDARGLTEPQVFRLTSGDVQVVIPGGTKADAARTRTVLESTGKLEVREVKYFLDRSHVKQDQYGNWTFASGYQNPKAPFEDVVYPAGEGEENQNRFYHLGKVSWEGKHVVDADPVPDPDTGGKALLIRLNAEGGARNHGLTRRLEEEGQKGNRGTDRETNGSEKAYGFLAICLDSKVESAPVVRGASTTSTQITGGRDGFSDDEVDYLQNVLKTGALTVTPRVISERVVGPSLGKETIEKGSISMLIALALVVVMMFAYYRMRLGVVANVSLVVTISLIFVVLSVFGATLTLPGLAGLVLTVGMAVDANILIFERLREELGEDVDIATGIENGYGRAFITIIDANLTTFLTALILYIFGAGPVQGFGLTLMIGIGTSMFGALYVGRMLTDAFYARSEKVEVPQLVKFQKVIGFTQYRVPALIMSSIVAVGSWIWFATGSHSIDDRFGQDFTGGYQIQVNFQDSYTNEELTKAFSAAYEANKDQASLLNPAQLIMLPYFADFAGAGDSSTQWVFKGRDLEGARLERQRAGEEDILAKANRLLEQQRNLPPDDRDEAAMADAKAKAAAAEKVVADLAAKLAKRQDIFKEELRQALPEGVAKEGDEIIAAAWQGRTLTFSLAVTSKPTAESLDVVKTELDGRADTESVTVAAQEKGDRHLVDISTTFSSDPGAVDEFEAVTPETKRLQKLLGVQSGNKVQLAKLKEADKYLGEVNEVLARQAISIDQPFPSSQHFSPLVGDQMKSASLIAMIISIFVILAYVAARFEFRYGIGAIIALVHDIVITIGLLSIAGIQIDLTVVAALLTIIGYSLNDTMVVFDRIRENIRTVEKPLPEIVDQSITQTMSRTLLTSMTTIIVVLILFIWGGDGLAAFSGTLLIGLLLGTYSSVFVAAPVLVMLNKGRPASALLSKALVEEDHDVGTDGYDGEDLDEEGGAAPTEPAR